MISLKNKFGNLRPRYLLKFQDLFNQLSQFGGGSEGDKYVGAKSFSNAYELYTYSFFIGLYKNQKIELTDYDKAKDFWEMKNWQPSSLTHSLITCAIAQSDFDMNAIEHEDEEFISKQIKLVKNEIESYANGGLSYIKLEIDQDPELLEDDLYFIKLLSD